MRKKILFVINTLSRAGAETAMTALLRLLAEEDFEISLYVILGQGEMIHELPQSIKVLNRTYSDMSVLSKSGRRYMKRTVLSRFFQNGKIIKKTADIFGNAVRMLKMRKVQTDKLLWRMLSDGGDVLDETYDLAVAYLEGGASYFTADHVKAKKKAAFVHIDYESAGYTKKMDRNCYAAYDRIFAVSDEVRESFLSVYPQWREKTYVFHNMIDRELILRRADEAGGFCDSFDGIRILTVGRLTAQKAYDIAIDTMKLLKEAGFHVRWYVLGEGSERAYLEKKIHALHLEQDFILEGAVENPYPYYRQTDIYVHATRFEGKSIALQEAQIFGCPIVASDCPGNREQVKNGEDGLLCPLSAEGIFESISALIMDKETRGRLKAAAAAKQLFYPDEIQMLFDLLT